MFTQKNSKTDDFVTFMQNFATFARSKCRKASGLIVQVIRAFLDADPSSAIELLKARGINIILDNHWNKDEFYWKNIF